MTSHENPLLFVCFFICPFSVLLIQTRYSRKSYVGLWSALTTGQKVNQSSTVFALCMRFRPLQGEPQSGSNMIENHGHIRGGGALWAPAPGSLKGRQKRKGKEDRKEKKERKEKEERKEGDKRGKDK